MSFFIIATEKNGQKNNNDRGRPNKLDRILQYEKGKKIPSVIPETILKKGKNLEELTELYPKEETCQICKTHPQLMKPVQITDKATVIGLTGVKNVKTHYRECPTCAMKYRYTEYEDGIHNFNDYIIFTLHLCLHVRESINLHTSIGTTFAILGKSMKLPKLSDLRQAYVHFESTTDHKYNYTCVICGSIPKIVIVDLHKKCCFNLNCKYNINKHFHYI